MNVELVRVKTADGMPLDGALSEPRGEPRMQVDGAVLLHGVGSNFYQPRLLLELAEGLASRGVRAVRGNTRGHDTIHTTTAGGGVVRQGAALECVDDCRMDIDAWLDLLADRGCRRLLLLGHSLGAIKAVYWQAQQPRPLVAAVAAFSPPRLSAAAFRDGDGREAYLESLSRAREAAAGGRGQQLLEVTFPLPMTMSADTFLDKYGAERYNVARLAPQLTCPALITYAEKELRGPAFVGLPDELRSGAPAAVELEIVSGADHSYHECGGRLLELLERKFPPA